LYCMNYYKMYNLPIKITRLFNVYGPGKKSLVVYDLIKKIIKNNDELIINGNGEQLRDFTYIDDIVSGLSIISKKGANGEIYHLGSGEAVTIRELAQKIISIMGIKNIKLLFNNKSYNGEFLKWYADISKVEGIGFNLKTNLEDGLEETINSIMKEKIK